MKTTKKLAALLVIISLGIALANCKKEVVGPTGPQGPKGDKGNANVQSYTLTASTWETVGSEQRATWSVSELTETVVNSAAVLVYLQDGTTWQALPFTYYPSSTYSRTFNFKYYTLGLRVSVSDSDNILPGITGTWTFRLVIIPQAAKIAGVNYSDPLQVKKAHHLSD